MPPWTQRSACGQYELTPGHAAFNHIFSQRAAAHRPFSLAITYILSIRGENSYKSRSNILNYYFLLYFNQYIGNRSAFGYKVRPFILVVRVIRGVL